MFPLPVCFVDQQVASFAFTCTPVTYRRRQHTLVFVMTIYRKSPSACVRPSHTSTAHATKIINEFKFARAYVVDEAKYPVGPIVS